jgi:hypothetical protein
MIFELGHIITRIYVHLSVLFSITFYLSAYISNYAKLNKVKHENLLVPLLKRDVSTGLIQLLFRSFHIGVVIQ